MSRKKRLLLYLITLVLAGGVPLPGRAANDAASGAELPYLPLRPANTDSPRSTIQSFLEDWQIVLDEHFREGRASSNQALAAYDRALNTMDFSSTPNGGSRWVQSESLTYLKEVLDKVPLPPEEEIPGAAEVLADGLTEWRIPGTRITLKRAESGLYEGEWQFSARTVQMLPRYYRQLKDLPYKPGAMEGLYETFRQNPTGIITREREVGKRLQAADTTSPRSTLEDFLSNINQAYDYAMQVDQALGAKPSTMTMEEARELGRLAEDHMARAIATLDLSEVPAALRYDTGVEAAMQIKEVLDRLTLAPIDSIPDLEMVREIRRKMGNNERPIRWVYPNTALEIVEVMEGSESGAFKFSPRTVAMARRYYEDVKDLPYRESYYGHFSAQYESATISPGFYQFYASTPGNLIPLATMWGRIVDRLPALFHKEVFAQPLWQWCAMVLLYALALLASIMVFSGNRRLTRHCPAPWNAWLCLFPPLLISGILYWVTRYITNEVNITGHSILTIITLERVLRTFLFSWGAFSLCRAVAETILSLNKIQEESVDVSLLRLSSRLVGMIFAAWIIISGLEGLGLDIWPLIAGLGIGGLAVALAFRPTMESIIGSFMIFADKPYQIGQRVKVLGADGTVESIGLRSTKVRLLNGHLTTIPNEKMASALIENIGQRPYIRRVFDITITYDTAPEKVNRAVALVREILALPETDEAPGGGDKPHPNARINQPGFLPRVYFNHLNADSLNILVIYWYHPPEYWDFLEHANWVNVQIMERFAAEGIDFAFPTQTLHLAGDPHRPLSVGQRWESDESGQSPMHLFSQAAAYGAHSALGNVSFASASDAIKPVPQAPESPRPGETGDTTEAPIEEAIMDPESGEAEPDSGRG